MMVRPNGRVARTRRLVSDLAFIKIREDSWRHQVYRDVRSVDGKPVRNRDDRLKKLFLEGSTTLIDQARAVAEESNRYNLGVNRVGVSPLLPLKVLDTDPVARFRFLLSGRTLTFDERLSPADPGFTEGGRRGNLTQHRSFVLDPETGAIETATLLGKTADGRVGSSFVVRYVDDPNMKLLVPAASGSSGSPKSEVIRRSPPAAFLVLFSAATRARLVASDLHRRPIWLYCFVAEVSGSGEGGQFLGSLTGSTLSKTRPP